MKFICFIAGVFLCFGLQAQSDTKVKDTSVLIVRPVDLGSLEFQDSFQDEFKGELDVIYYHFYGGVQMIEVDYFSFSIERGKHEDRIHPRGGSSYMDAYYRNDRNTYIFRNLNGKILSIYNKGDFKVRKLISPNKAFTISHSEGNSNLEYGRNRQGGSRKGLYSFQTTEGVGVLDSLGNILLEPNDWRIVNHGDSYLISNGSKWGVYDYEFNVVVDHIYNRLQPIGKDKLMACIDSCGCINTQGDLIVPFQYEEINFFDQDPKRFMVYTKNGLLGLIDRNFNEITSAKYRQMYFTESGYFATDTTNFYGILNSEGQEITPFKYRQGLPRLLPSGHYQVQIHNEDYVQLGYERRVGMGFVDSLGNEVGELKYIRVKDFKNGTAAVELASGWGLINSEGKEITEFYYDDIRNDYENYIIVKIGNLYGLLTPEGKEILPTVYEQILCVQDDLILVRNTSRKMSYVNNENKELFPFIYDQMGCFSEGFSKVWVDGKAGYVNKQGVEITGYIYDNVYDFKKGVGLVKKGDKFGCINTKGEVLVEPKYESVSQEKRGFYKFTNGSKSVLIPYVE
ncbi:MAG: hypothetical protein ACJASQ_003529 [Crocinitomicaceae bacterium]|jgi:hypothetical protein